MKLYWLVPLACWLSSLSLPAFTLTSIHSFSVAPSGATPTGALISSGDLVYGTARNGGTNGGGGTVFSVGTNGSFKLLYSFNGYGDGGSLIAGPALDNSGNIYGVTAYGGPNGLGTVFKLGSNGLRNLLYAFGSVTNASSTPLDGSHPEGELFLGKDGNFYGTTSDGGTFDKGTVFRISTNGLLTTLYSFGTLSYFDGSQPLGGLVQGADGAFYGTTTSGGANNPAYGGYGTVFRITTNGTLNTLHSFNLSDGANPQASLIKAPDGTLYGTTSSGWGTIFQITTNGAFATLYSFSSIEEGSAPEARLLLASDGNLYGTTSNGGTNYQGTLFKLTTSGVLTNLVQFGGLLGAAPSAGLVQASDGKLYGVTQQGGTNNVGVVFCVTTNGSLTVLYSFPQANDGASPSADLMFAKDGYFYGTTQFGGDIGVGTAFRMSLSGDVTLLHSFGSDTDFLFDPLDGAYPQSTLIQGQDGGLYGTCTSGGDFGNGTVYRITTNGVFTVLHSFDSSEGSSPWGGLVQTPDGAMYGTTLAGGANDDGTVFRITTDGTVTSLYSFSGPDGANPSADLILGPDNLLYGTTSTGDGVIGTVFKIDTNGILNTLHAFSENDGSYPESRVFMGIDGALYGTTAFGGTYGLGTVFRIANGLFTTLVHFNGTNGSKPLAGVVQTADGNIYGTASEGGNGTNGLIFQLATNGILTTVSLDGIQGSNPNSGFVLGPGGNLYTMAMNGGLGGYGNVIRLDIAAAAPLFQKLSKSGNSVLMTWNGAVLNRSYQMQFKTNLAQAIWNNLGTSITATNTTMQSSDSPGTDARRFYRLELLP
jgi:uncharacterized repeat protein (TIGR03803 family)